MAEVKCEKCGRTFFTGTNKVCPTCGTPAPGVTLTQDLIEAQKAMEASVLPKPDRMNRQPDVKPASAILNGWSKAHNVLGWICLVACAVLTIIGIYEYWDEEFVILAYVGASCLYFFMTSAILRGLSVITKNAEESLKEKNIPD